MSIEALGLITTKLHSLNINYEFGSWTKAPSYPYFVGEYNELESTTEDGLQESNFILTGFSRGTWLELEQAKETIENFIKEWDVTIGQTGNAIVITYSSSMVIPTEDAELKKIQINLNVKEWKVN